MPDVVDALTRSRMMSGIRSANTKPELLVRRGLHARGYRFRLHAKNLVGHPDIVLPKHRAAVFVHGCFWHGHDCSLFRMPGSRVEFWTQKISLNRARDEKVRNALLSSGWRCLTVWECAVKGPGKLGESETVGRAVEWLESNDMAGEIRGVR